MKPNQHNTYYKIGITNNPKRRRLEHERRLPGWIRTVNFTVIRLPDPSRAGVVELNMTLEYMAAYGMRRVHGSRFDSPMQLTYPKWVQEAYRLVAAILQRCYYCHASSHIGVQCDNKKRLTSVQYFIEHGVKGYTKPNTTLMGRHVWRDVVRRQHRLKKMLSCTLLSATQPRYNLRSHKSSF